MSENDRVTSKLQLFEWESDGYFKKWPMLLQTRVLDSGIVTGDLNGVRGHVHVCICTNVILDNIT